jgi:hypothetical protein
MKRREKQGKIPQKAGRGQEKRRNCQGFREENRVYPEKKFCPQKAEKANPRRCLAGGFFGGSAYRGFGVCVTGGNYCSFNAEQAPGSGCGECACSRE